MVRAVLLVAALLHGAALSAAPAVKRLDAATLRGEVFQDPATEISEEDSELGRSRALDLPWYASADGCIESGVYQTGANRYTITEPYPYDELMLFLDGGVTLRDDSGVTEVRAGDAIWLPKGWTGVWDSTGYRKIYLIYDCPD